MPTDTASLRALLIKQGREQQAQAIAREQQAIAREQQEMARAAKKGAGRSGAAGRPV